MRMRFQFFGLELPLRHRTADNNLHIDKKLSDVS
jgi:hypothetical protein